MSKQDKHESIMNYLEYKGFKDKAKDRSILKDRTGRFLTQALFLETNKTELGYKPLYSIRSGENKKGLPSARDIYLASVDEYDASIKLVGSVDHWQRLTSVNPNGEYTCRWFMLGTEEFEGLLAWREEMRLRDESFAKAVLQEQALEGNVSAAKALLELTKQKAAVGRPSQRVPKDEKRQATLQRMRSLGVTVHES